MAENKGTMESMFLNRTLKRIIEDSNAKKLARLKESCSTTLELIEKIGVSPKVVKEHTNLDQVDKVINKLIITLKLACESKQPKIISNALDCLQKLIAYGYIRVGIKDIEKPERRLIDKVMEIIGDCFDSTDDNVQLQIIKAFLTAVSSPFCEIHEHTLMNAVRACFNIYLVSKNKVNQNTAKATLSQILTIIFQRFEKKLILLKLASVTAQDERKKDEPVSTPAPIAIEESKAEKTEEELELSEETSTIDLGPDSNPSPPTTVHVDHPSDDEKAAPVLISEIVAPIVKEDVVAIVPPVGMTLNMNIAYADCFLIFRALCKLSTKELPATASAESVDMRRKLLALELLQNIIDTAGEQLKKSNRFINNAIKKYLFVPLLLNGVSPFIRVFRTSLNIFYGLINNFKDHLKTEIGMFFTKILLRILGSSNSSIQHKYVVLGVLHKICKQAQILVDIFLNYDCHLDSVDVFEKTVNELSSIAKGTPLLSSNVPVAQQEVAVCALALECLVTIMRSLVQWSSELTEGDPHPPNNTPTNSNNNTAMKPTASKPSLLLKSSNPADLSNENIMGGRGQGNEEIPVEKFAQQKLKKQQVEHGKQLFNYKPKRGIQYLTKLGHIGPTSKDVAKFLLYTEGLDRTQIGDYLGDISNPFCKSVLYDYVDLQSFEDMEIYDALLNFLLGFRLPGEGQKIDVIMEKFAERYYNDNQHKIPPKSPPHSSSPSPPPIVTALPPSSSTTTTTTTTNTGVDSDSTSAPVVVGQPNNTITTSHTVNASRRSSNMNNTNNSNSNSNNNSNVHPESKFVFGNADSVYIFAYHMIMLATDLHHKAVKKKITKAEWIKNNTGLNDGKDFPEEFLLQIYDYISVNPLRVREDDPNIGGPAPGSNTTGGNQQLTGSTAGGAANINLMLNPDLMSPKQRQTLFHKESKIIVKKSQELLEDKLQKRSKFFKSTNIRHVKPMFEMCWCPMLAAFSVVLEKAQDSDKEIFTLCLDGFRCAIRVSSIFFLETERNAFVSSLSRFTLLANLREMRLKNIQAIHSLIQIAHQDGNYLQDSWLQILMCLSQLEKIKFLTTTNNNNSNSSNNNASSSSSGTHSNPSLLPSVSVSRTISNGNVNGGVGVGGQLGVPLSVSVPNVGGGASTNALILANSNGELDHWIRSSIVDSIDINEIEKLFSNTIHLNDNAIVEFVGCLCRTSLSEVMEPEPRTFSLQKLIEIAYYNMARIRFVWTRIWGLMASHFQIVGCHDNQQVAMYAIDSLRQLSMKFLEKDELANYHFQKDFLKPFEVILQNNPQLPVRELIVRCLSQMIQARADNIKSGWKSILVVFALVASDHDSSVVQLAYDMTYSILSAPALFQLVSTSFFVDVITCLVSFAANRAFPSVALSAIRSLVFCAHQLAQGLLKVNEVGSTNNEESQSNITDTTTTTTTTTTPELLENIKNEIGRAHV